MSGGIIKYIVTGKELARDMAESTRGRRVCRKDFN